MDQLVLNRISIHPKPAMTPNPCPKCGQSIPAANINMEQGAALCAACGTLSRLEDVLDVEDTSEALKVVPHGCSTNVVGDEIRVRATLRSCGGMAAALAVGLFWNGILSVFLVQAFAGLYSHFVGPLPAWFPAPQGGGMPLGATLFLCVFLIPFVVIGLMLIGGFFMSLAGHVEVRIRGTDGMVCTGIGSLVWPRRFNPALVKRIDIGETKWKQNDQTKPTICIQADKTINFGSMLSDERRTWLRSTVVSMLLSSSKKN